MTALAPRCGRVLPRRERPGRPVLEGPVCGRPEGHRGTCRSAAALRRAALRRRGVVPPEPRDWVPGRREALLLKGHARAVALRRAGRRVPARVRALDSEYRRMRERRTAGEAQAA